MDLSTLETELSSQIYKKAEHFIKKNAVRELEAVSDSDYTAFVDEGDDCYDVAISIHNRIAKNCSCDCNSDIYPCAHIGAVLIELSQRGSGSTKKASTKKIKARKKDELRDIIDEVPIDQLREWIYQIAKKDKALVLLLNKSFKSEVVILDEKVINAKTNEITKAVLGRVKYYDTSQINQIIKLWQSYHQEVIEMIFNRYEVDGTLQDPLFNSMIANIAIYSSQSKKSSTKVSTYIKELYQYFSNKFALLPIEKQKELLIDFIPRYTKNTYDNGFMFEVICTFSNILPIDTLKSLLFPLIDRLSINTRVAHLNQLKVSLEDHSLLPHFLNAFKPVQYMTSYNLDLADTYLKYEKIIEAEKIYLSMLQYLDEKGLRDQTKLKLIEIYRSQDDIAAMQNHFLGLHIGINYDVETFKYISDRLEGEQKLDFERKFRLIVEDINQEPFFYWLIKYYYEKGDLLSLLKSLSTSYPVDAYLPYLPDMVKSYKKLTLESIAHMRRGRFYYNYMDRKSKCKLTQELIKYYAEDEIINMIYTKKIGVHPLWDSTQDFHFCKVTV